MIHFLKEDLKATIFSKSLKIIEWDQIIPNIIWVKLSSLRIWSLIICTISWPRENNEAVQSQQVGGWMLKRHSRIVLVFVLTCIISQNTSAFPHQLFSKKEPIIALVAFGSYIECTNVSRKLCWNEGHKYATVQFTSKKHSCVGKPLWWAHTSSACKSVVNNRCLIVHVAALCSFRESDTFSSSCNSLTWYWIIGFVCSINALLSRHMSLYLFGWKFGLR